MDLLTHSGRQATTLLLAAAVFGTPAAAQVLSPGKLGRAHTKIEGLANCTKCHVLGKRVDGGRCLECHKELAELVNKKQGLHASKEHEGKACTACHQEHRGVDAALSDWEGPKKSFDHRQTGYTLTGKHLETECKKCHRPELIDNPELRKRMEERHDSTHLGLVRSCARCHFDEHRRQLPKTKCDDCHEGKAFKPAPKFKHDVTWPLLGKHLKAECIKCHPFLPDPAAATYGAIPAPKDPKQYAIYKPLEGTTCNVCHEDVHTGKFGKKCETCHTEFSFQRTRLRPGDIAFHRKTRFPLLGRHQEVPCKNCHPMEGGRRKSRGIPFEQCGNCHRDAHFAQLPKDDSGFVPCQRCHNEEGFFPPRYPLAEHNKGRYPLERAHLSTPCNLCHLDDPEGFAQKFPEAIPEEGQPIKRNELLDFTVLRMREKDLKACESCHRDDHGGQFTQGKPVKACKDCHNLDAFRDELFKHEKDSPFKLLGKHAKVPCNDCHPIPAPGKPRLYRGVTTSCRACHADAHFGQFLRAGEEAPECSQCHDHQGFKPTTFKHAMDAASDEASESPTSVFPLLGKHQKVECLKCHPKIRLEDGRETLWYRGVPTRCQECHVDRHDQKASRSDDCNTCHDNDGWQEVTFLHDETRLPLRGRHEALSCRSCHQDLGRLQLDSSCSSCHRDPHAGRLDEACEQCHQSSSFRDGVGVEAHGRSRFPLYGAHAQTACDQCHQARSDRTFSGVPTRCQSCHENAYLSTRGGRVDHTLGETGTECVRCHNTIVWARGTLPEHSQCFPIVGGPHRNIACFDCHTEVPGLTVNTCSSFTASCVRCHSCGPMDRKHLGEVAGYQCVDRKCYECHPDGKEGD